MKNHIIKIILLLTIFYCGNISAQIGSSISNPINAGSFNKAFTYNNSQNSSNFKNNNGGLANDVYYKFTISEPMEITIHNWGSPSPTTNLFLYDEYNDILSESDGSWGIGGSLNIRQAYLKRLLHTGTYYIMTEGSYCQENNGVIKTTIEGKIPQINNNVQVNFDSQEGRYVPIPTGVYNKSFLFQDARDTRQYGNVEYITNDIKIGEAKDVYYQFEITQPMDITIHHLGSPISGGTCVYLIRVDENEVKLIDSFLAKSYQPWDERLSPANKAYIEVKNLPKGKYLVYSEGVCYTSNTGKSPTEGVIITNIEGKLREGVSKEASVNVGIKNAKFSYSDLKDTQWFSPFGNKTEPGSIYYKVELAKVMDITVSNTNVNCTSIPMDSEITIYNEKGNIVNSKKETSSNAVSVKTDSLDLGTYYIVSKAGQSGNKEITTSIGGVLTPIIGDSLHTAINLGIHNNFLTYIDTRNTKIYCDIFQGKKTNEVFYKFTLSQKMNVQISHCGSELQNTYITILNSLHTPIANSEKNSNSNYYCYTPGQAIMNIDLNPGTYYIVSEGTILNGLITIQIEGSPSTGINNESLPLKISTHKNYIHSIIPSVETSTYADLPAEKALQSIQYFDGLGRPEQTVQKGVTPMKQDLILFQEYDSFGRNSKSWLPVTNYGGGQAIEFEALKAKAQNRYLGDPAPYSSPVYESSPLSRVLEEYGPGQNWHGNSKSVKHSYLTNKGETQKSTIDLDTADMIGGVISACDRITLKPGFHFKATPEKSLILYPDPSQCQSPKLAKSLPTNRLAPTYLIVSNYSVENKKLVKNGNYLANELYVTVAENEDESTVIDFKNKQGQSVLSRQLNGKEKYDTYYVYDNWGNLCYVLPPMAIDNLTTDLLDAG